MQSEFQRCLIDLDIPAAKKLWAHCFPHLAQPADDNQTLFMLHRARTEAQSIPLKLRAYSHRWLLDNGYPSGLPDELKPKAERMYPKIVTGVGISVNFKSTELKPVADAVHRAMSDAVMTAYADNETDPAIVKALMMQARKKTISGLLG